MSDWTTTKVRHGTPSGWRQHMKVGERPCDPCFFAKQKYDKRLRSSTQGQIKNRLRAKAQSRAESALVARHRAEYSELYEIEQENLRRDGRCDTCGGAGKVWITDEDEHDCEDCGGLGYGI